MISQLGKPSPYPVTTEVMEKMATMSVDVLSGHADRFDQIAIGAPVAQAQALSLVSEQLRREVSERAMPDPAPEVVEVPEPIEDTSTPPSESASTPEDTEPDAGTPSDGVESFPDATEAQQIFIDMAPSDLERQNKACLVTACDLFGIESDSDMLHRDLLALVVDACAALRAASPEDNSTETDE